MFLYDIADETEESNHFNKYFANKKQTKPIFK